MKPNQETFGICRSTLVIIAVAITFGSFSVYKARGGGSLKVAGTFRVPSGTLGRTELSEVPAITNLGSATLTKADAPCPAVKTTLTPIEQILVGDRVLAESPTGEEDTAFGSEIIPADWRKLTLRAPKRDGTVAEVVLLRPLTWLNEQHGEVGGTVFISVPECGIDGNANVLAIDPCPEIHSGTGRVVTGTFLHQARSTITLTIAGQSEPIECTGNHPFWSEGRQIFVRADSLQPNETLRTANGLTTVESWTHDLNPTPVYNIEVHGAHVYHVGTSGVVVHNGTGLPIVNPCMWTELPNGRRVTVIGRMDDVRRFSDNPLVDNWDKSGPEGRFELWKNRKWIQERIERGDIFVLATDPSTLSSVQIPGVPNGFYTFQELKWLRLAGVEVMHIWNKVD